MKTTLDKIKLDYARHYQYKDWIDFLENTDNLSHDKAIDDIAKEYAIEVAKQTQRNCSDGVEPDRFIYFDGYHKTKNSILSETNTPKLD